MPETDYAAREANLDDRFGPLTGLAPAATDSLRDDLAAERARFVEKSGEEGHFYGAWKGGAKASGGSAGAAPTKAARVADLASKVGAENVGNVGNLKQEAFPPVDRRGNMPVPPPMPQQYGGVVPQPATESVMANSKETRARQQAAVSMGVRGENDVVRPPSTGVSLTQRERDMLTSRRAARQPASLLDRWLDSKAEGLRQRLTTTVEATAKRSVPLPKGMREAGEDHFYGAWKGGSKAEGGGPVKSGGLKEQPFGGARWKDADALIGDMEAKYPGSDWKDIKKVGDWKVASGVADQIDVLCDRFGPSPGFKGVRVEDGKHGVIAEVKRVDPSTPGSAVYLYSHYFAAPDAMQKAFAGAKATPNWSVSNQAADHVAYARSIVTHEMGHQYMGMNLHSRLGPDRNAAVRQDIEPWFKSLQAVHGSQHISQYSRNTPHELWAEAFAAAVGQGTTKSHWPTQLKAILDKHYPPGQKYTPANQSGASKYKALMGEAAAEPEADLGHYVCAWARSHPDVKPMAEAAGDDVLEEWLDAVGDDDLAEADIAWDESKVKRDSEGQFTTKSNIDPKSGERRNDLAGRMVQRLHHRFGVGVDRMNTPEGREALATLRRVRAERKANGGEWTKKMRTDAIRARSFLSTGANVSNRDIHRSMKGDTSVGGAVLWRDRARMPGKVKEAGDDHFYGAWKGGAKASGGHPMTKGEQKEALINRQPSAYTTLDTEARFYDPDRKVWNQKRAAEVHEPIIDSMLAGVEHTAEPILYMTGGGMGSGKTTVREFAGAGFPGAGKAAIVDPDEAKGGIKKNTGPGIPEYKAMLAKPRSKRDPMAAGAVHEESSHIAKTAVARGLSQHMSVLYDTSGDSGAGKLGNKVANFRRLGATKVYGEYAWPGSVKEAIARSDDRAKRTGRYVPHALLRANHEGVAATWLGAARAGTFDRLRLWSTSGPFGSSPTLIAEVVDGRIKVHNRPEFRSFAESGRVRNAYDDLIDFVN